MPRRPAATLSVLFALVLAGCGSASHTSSAPRPPSTSTPSTTATAASPPPAIDQLAAAERPAAAGFPTPHGLSLRAVAATIHTGAQLGAATGTFTPGHDRFAFAITTSSGAFVYAPTVVYLARHAGDPAQGPFLAPADPLTVPAQYRSAQNRGPGGLQAIYATYLPLPRPGTYLVLAVTHGPNGVIGSTGEVAVASNSPIPNVGQRPPAIDTDTVASVHGDLALLTTRTPPESMHSVSLRQVLGRRPVALLFSTPQLCISKVCGPVTDIAVEMQHEFGSRITFIHEEVYVDNQPTKGLRPQLKAFHLETEPWLFTINRRGIIAARLEGSFGVNAFRHAIEAALR